MIVLKKGKKRKTGEKKKQVFFNIFFYCWAGSFWTLVRTSPFLFFGTLVNNLMQGKQTNKEAHGQCEKHRNKKYLGNATISSGDVRNQVGN